MLPSCYFAVNTEVPRRARRFWELKMTSSEPLDIEVEFARCCLCNRHIEESARDPYFVRVKPKDGS
jgi:uncharacterized protein with PIN domain